MEMVWEMMWMDYFIRHFISLKITEPNGTIRWWRCERSRTGCWTKPIGDAQRYKTWCFVLVQKELEAYLRPLFCGGTPWKINGWNLQITHLERKMIFQTSMIMFHVNLQGCAVDGSEIQRENQLIWRFNHHLQDSVIHTSQTVQDFFHQPYVGKYQGSCNESQEMWLDVGLGSLGQMAHDFLCCKTKHEPGKMPSQWYFPIAGAFQVQSVFKNHPKYSPAPASHESNILQHDSTIWSFPNLHYKIRFFRIFYYKPGKIDMGFQKNEGLVQILFPFQLDDL